MVHAQTPLRALAVAGLVAAALALPAAAQSPSAAPSTGPVASAAASPAGPAITVTARDYLFEGLPTSVPAGTSLTLTNAGTELHELIVVRKNDGVTQTWDELIALPEGESDQYVTFLGVLIADPGADGASPEDGSTSILLDTEGDYLAICFIPEGMTSMAQAMASPDPGASFGPPHFLLGMRQEFAVTAAGTESGPMPSPAASGMPGHSMAPASVAPASPGAS
jgi:hypothetical protein